MGVRGRISAGPSGPDESHSVPATMEPAQSSPILKRRPNSPAEAALQLGLHWAAGGESQKEERGR
jgi:hypothetical protein